MSLTEEEKDFLGHPEVQHYFQKDLNLVIAESDRGAVLIAASIIDEQLKRLFETVATNKLSKKRLKEILNYPGPLGSFAAKLDIAFLNRLIDENLYNSIQQLRKIRNAVAHEKDKFRLKDYEKELIEIYNFGIGLPNLLRNLSADVILKTFINELSEAEINLGVETKKLFNNPKEILDALSNHAEGMNIFEEKLYRVELGFGIGIICGLINLHREKTKQALGENSLISSLSSKVS